MHVSIPWRQGFAKSPVTFTTQKSLQLSRAVWVLSRISAMIVCSVTTVTKFTSIAVNAASVSSLRQLPVLVLGADTTGMTVAQR